MCVSWSAVAHCFLLQQGLGKKSLSAGTHRASQAVGEGMLCTTACNNSKPLLSCFSVQHRLNANCKQHRWEATGSVQKGLVNRSGYCKHIRKL